MLLSDVRVDLPREYVADESSKRQHDLPAFYMKGYGAQAKVATPSEATTQISAKLLKDLFSSWEMMPLWESWNAVRLPPFDVAVYDVAQGNCAHLMTVEKDNNVLGNTVNINSIMFCTEFWRIEDHVRKSKMCWNVANVRLVALSHIEWAVENKFTSPINYSREFSCSVWTEFNRINKFMSNSWIISTWINAFPNSCVEGGSVIQIRIAIKLCRPPALSMVRTELSPLKRGNRSTEDCVHVRHYSVLILHTFINYTAENYQSDKRFCGNVFKRKRFCTASFI